MIGFLPFSSFLVNDGIFMIPFSSGSERSSNLNSSREVMYSPKAAARAIGVSESSLKRWCDAGKISVIKTAGGHRRLKQANIISFLREKNKYELQDPLSIGLPDLSEFSVSNPADAARQYHRSLVAEEDDRCHRLLTYLYVNGWQMEEIVDQVVSEAFKQIGNQWQQGSLEIYQERRASEICLESLGRIKTMLNPPEAPAFSAIGGTVEHDHYTLCTKSLEVSLISHGWQAKSLGSNLPFSTLLQAALTKRPNLMWVSVSYLKDEDSFIRGINAMAERIPRSTTLVVGGFAIKPWFWPRIKNAMHCENIVQLFGVVKQIEKTVTPSNFPSSIPPQF